MKSSEIEGLAKGFAPVIKEFVKAALAPLEQRIAALEARPDLKHCGVWKRDVRYQTNALVTHAGGLWLATVDAKGVKPGDGALWKLIVKSGDAR